MKVAAITGGIASGKSYVCNILRELGASIFDSDLTVHLLYQNDQSLKQQLVDNFGDIIIQKNNQQVVDRTLLAQKLSNDKSKWETLESIVHPKVRKAAEQFLTQCRRENTKLAILDIPLLQESSLHYNLDNIILVCAPLHIRKLRALKRPNMSAEKFAYITNKQLNDCERFPFCNFIISNTNANTTKSQTIALQKALTTQL